MRANTVLALAVTLVAPTASNAQTFAEQRDALIQAFLTERSFVLVQRLDALPEDVQGLLTKFTDGTFAIAERGEDWNIGEFGRPGLKGASHIISGVSNGLAVVLARGGGSISVTTGIDIYDRQRGVGIHCVANLELARQWNGNNHTRELVREPCWELPIVSNDK